MPTKQGNDNDEKIFFTRSDLLERLNSSLEEVDNITGDGICNRIEKPKFELQKRLPDGSSISADAADIAAANFQDKLKQAAAEVASLSAEEKLEWAKKQRQHGNSFFAKEKYKEAMDIYMTCLVAMDSACCKKINETEPDKNNDGCTQELINRNVDPSSTKECLEPKISNIVDKMQRELQLPVLLNLSLCTLKLGMLKKTERFCDYAMETPCGRENAKVYFRRGRARMLMGLYRGAQKDFKTSLTLLSKEDKETVRFPTSEIRTEISDTTREKESVIKEINKLNKLVNAAKVNSNRQKNAMQKILGGQRQDIKSKSVLPTLESNMEEESDVVDELLETSYCEFGNERNKSTSHKNSAVHFYQKIQPRRSHSNLTAASTTKPTQHDCIEETKKLNRFQTNDVKKSPFLMFLSCFEKCLRRVLYILGDEDAMHRSYDEIVLEDRRKQK